MDEPALQYSGLWHVDGTDEHVKSVLLYYTRMDDELEGGGLAFVDRMVNEDVQFGWRSDISQAIKENTRSLPVSEAMAVCFDNERFIHR